MCIVQLAINYNVYISIPLLKRIKCMTFKNIYKLVKSRIWYGLLDFNVVLKAKKGVCS